MLTPPNILKRIKDWQFCLLFIIIAIVFTIIILKNTHNTRDVANIWVFLLKLIPFISALLAIAYLPSWFKRPWDLLLILLSFAVILIFFMARISYTAYNSDYLNFYLLLQIFVPYIILCLVFAYKVGGGNKKDTIVLGTIAIIFMLSGVEDVAYHLINPHTVSFSQALPDKWTWASHITVRVGRVINKYEIFPFMGIHFLLILCILYFAYFHKKVLHMIKTKKEVNREKTGKIENAEK